MDGEAIEDIVFKRIGGGGYDAIIRAGLPSFGEEFMKDGGFNRGVGSEDGDVLTGGAKDFVNEVGDDGLSGGPSNADEFHVANRATIIRG